MTYLWDFRSQSIAGPGPTPGPGWPASYWSPIWPSTSQCVWEPGMFYCQEGCQLPACQVMLNKARALYLVRVSVTCEIIDRREKGGVGGKKKHILGNYCWLCSKLIELGGGGSKNCLLWRTQSMHITIFCLVGQKIKITWTLCWSLSPCVNTIRFSRISGMLYIPPWSIPV